MIKLKSVLSKLRPDRISNKKVQTVEQIASIKHSTDAIGWRPVAYITPVRFGNFLQNVDSDIEGFVEKAKPDQYNGKFYVKTVEEEVKLALDELAIQQVEHLRAIHNIRTYQHASLEDIKKQLENFKETLEELKVKEMMK